MVGAGAILKTLCWLTLSLSLIIFSFAVVAHRVVGESGEWTGTTDPDLLYTREPFEAWDNVEYFGSLGVSLFTMVQFLTLSQWGDHIARPILRLYPTLLPFFFLFILGTVYGVLISILSTFIERALESARVVKLGEAAIELEERKRISHIVMDLITCIDENNDGQLDAAELDKALAVPVIRKALINLGVPDQADGQQLIAMIDRSGDALVSHEELIDRLAQMNNNITPRDIVKLSIGVTAVFKRAETFNPRFSEMGEELTDVTRKFLETVAAIKTWQDQEVMKESDRKARWMSKHYVPVPPVDKALEAVGAAVRAKEADLDEYRKDEVRAVISLLQGLNPLPPQQGHGAARPHTVPAMLAFAASGGPPLPAGPTLGGLGGLPLPGGLPGAVVDQQAEVDDREQQQRERHGAKLRDLGRPHKELLPAAPPPVRADFYRLLRKAEAASQRADPNVNPLEVEGSRALRKLKQELKEQF